jgi:hypothetical protein
LKRGGRPWDSQPHPPRYTASRQRLADQLTLRQADPARDDFAAIIDDLDFIKIQLARLLTRNEVWRAAMLGCAAVRSQRSL